MQDADVLRNNVTVLGRLKRWAGLEGKTAWDWLNILIVPLALAILGYVLTDQQQQRQQALADQRAEEEALQAYLDQMSILMIDGHLRSAEDESEERLLARARTVTVLSRLGANPTDREISDDDLESNKEIVVEFLLEAGLVQKIDGKEPVISLREAELTQIDLDGEDLSGAFLGGARLQNANLEGAILKGANLRRADLSGANLRRAELSGADLGGVESGANLSRADLSGADLNGTNLSQITGISEEELSQQADSLEGATMPNGQKYEDWLKSKSSGEE